MDWNIPLILVILTFFTGLIWLLDVLFWAPSRRNKATAEGKNTSAEAFEQAIEPNWFISNMRSFFPIFLAVLLIRSFLVQPFRVPTGSLEPTVLPGDFIAVNQYAYGLRLPVLNYKFVNIGEPKRGDPPHRVVPGCRVAPSGVPPEPPGASNKWQSQR